MPEFSQFLLHSSKRYILLKAQNKKLQLYLGCKKIPYFLHHNQLTGEVPDNLWNLTNISRIELGDNQLTGEIPSEVGNFENLQTGEGIQKFKCILLNDYWNHEEKNKYMKYIMTLYFNLKDNDIKDNEYKTLIEELGLFSPKLQEKSRAVAFTKLDSVSDFEPLD